MRASCIGVGVGIVMLAGCDTGASSEPGYGALLQIPGAQFRPGPLPAPSGGPDTLAARSYNPAITIGEAREPITGTLGVGARAALIGLADTDGTWVLPAGLPTFDAPDHPTVATKLGVADDFPPGPFDVLVVSSDATGRFGAPAAISLVAEPEAPPAGELVIGLAWSGVADLDLHVVDPLGGEAWSDDPNTWVPPPPGEPVDPAAYLVGGVLDRDGNADCHRDARPAEHIIWAQPPPSGNYVVRVDARSMCGGASEAWYVTAYRGETLLGAARGVATTADVSDHGHGAGAGVTAVRFAL